MSFKDEVRQQDAADLMTISLPSSVTKFRKKPVVIDAVQWDGSNVQAITMFVAASPIIIADCKRIATFDYTTSPPSLSIPTPEGDHIANVGDWIIRGVKGECYPCKPDIFAMTYEPVE